MKKEKVLIKAAIVGYAMLGAAVLQSCSGSVSAQQQNSVIGDGLQRIEEGSNFVVYKLKHQGNEYIIVNGINGVAAIKHR